MGKRSGSAQRGSSYIELLILVGVVGLAAFGATKYFGTGIFNKASQQADTITTIPDAPGESPTVSGEGAPNQAGDEEIAAAENEVDDAPPPVPAESIRPRSMSAVDTPGGDRSGALAQLADDVRRVQALATIYREQEENHGDGEFFDGMTKGIHALSGDVDRPDPARWSSVTDDESVLDMLQRAQDLSGDPARAGEADALAREAVRRSEALVARANELNRQWNDYTADLYGTMDSTRTGLRWTRNIAAGLTIGLAAAPAAIVAGSTAASAAGLGGIGTFTLGAGVATGVGGGVGMAAGCAFGALVDGGGEAIANAAGGGGSTNWGSHCWDGTKEGLTTGALAGAGGLVGKTIAGTVGARSAVVHEALEGVGEGAVQCSVQAASGSGVGSIAAVTACVVTEALASSAFGAASRRFDGPNQGDVIGRQLVSGRQVKLATQKEANEIASRFGARVAIFGHGSKSQFQSMDEVKKDLLPMVNRLNAEHGQGGWLAVFGGDPFNPDAPDVSHIVKWLKDEHGVAVMAFQSDKVDLEWGGVDDYIDFVHYVPTDYSAPNADGKRSVLWGGVQDGQLVGASKGYLDPEFAANLDAVVAVGGGPIALDEIRYARETGVPVAYVAARAAVPEANGEWGPVHDWARQDGVPTVDQLFAGETGATVPDLHGGARIEWQRAHYGFFALRNELPQRVARVVPADIDLTTLGPPGSDDVFVTAARDIEGLDAEGIAERLAIPLSPNGYRVIEFDMPEIKYTPVGRDYEEFVYGGLTAGGAREFAIPNGQIPANAKTRIVP